MKKSVFVGLVTAVGALGLSSAAQAGGITEACFMKSYVEAKYAYGKKLIKSEYRTWTNLDNGPGLVTRERHPSVYMQTSRKTANDHYILVPVACK